jgi:hypothetical protein
MEGSGFIEVAALPAGHRHTRDGRVSALEQRRHRHARRTAQRTPRELVSRPRGSRSHSVIPVCDIRLHRRAQDGIDSRSSANAFTIAVEDSCPGQAGPSPVSASPSSRLRRFCRGSPRSSTPCSSPSGSCFRTMRRSLCAARSRAATNSRFRSFPFSPHALLRRLPSRSDPSTNL